LIWINARGLWLRHLGGMDPSLIRLFEAARLPRYTSYPTAVQFTPSVGPAQHAEWLARIPAGSRVSLYLHVPYCHEICWYCACSTHALGRPERASAYADLLLTEFELLAARLPPDLAVAHLHWGGGTPSVLGKDLIRVMNRVRERLRFASDVEIAMEIDPRVFEPGMAAPLADAGLSRASLGVQSFDPAVQKAINRHQSFEQTGASVEALRGAGVRGINIDLIYGLPNQTMANAADTARLAASLHPNRLSVFGYAHLPAQRPHQRLIDEAGLPGVVQRLHQFLSISHTLEDHGYVPVGLDHFALPDDAMAEAARTGSLRRNFQGYTTDAADTLIGLGCSSISAFSEGYAQNAADLAVWRREVGAGRLPVVRGVALSAEDRARRAAIEAVMCRGRVAPKAIASRLGVPLDLVEPDRQRVDDLVALGVVERHDSELAVAPGHQPLMRLLAAAFDRYLAPGAARHAPAV
jgi:oxygen-independent coproporphyrinogen-3 oxidase